MRKKTLHLEIEKERFPKKYTMAKEKISVEIQSGVFTLGRLPYNDIVLPYSTISLIHARLYVVGRLLFIEDLDSMNGTFHDVYGVCRTQMTLIQPGDSIRLADIPMRVLLDLPTQPAEPHPTIDTSRPYSQPAPFVGDLLLTTAIEELPPYARDLIAQFLETHTKAFTDSFIGRLPDPPPLSLVPAHPPKKLLKTCPGLIPMKPQEKELRQRTIAAQDSSKLVLPLFEEKTFVSEEKTSVARPSLAPELYQDEVLTQRRLPTDLPPLTPPTCEDFEGSTKIHPLQAKTFIAPLPVPLQALSLPHTPWQKPSTLPPPPASPLPSPLPEEIFATVEQSLPHEALLLVAQRPQPPKDLPPQPFLTQASASSPKSPEIPPPVKLHPSLLVCTQVELAEDVRRRFYPWQDVDTPSLPSALLPKPLLPTSSEPSALPHTPPHP